MQWVAHPGPQSEALRRNEFEILYGGSRGPGKTDAGLVWIIDPANKLYLNPRFRGLVIRRNAEDLSDWVDRARRMYNGLTNDFAYRPTEIKFPSGAIIKTGHLKDDQAYSKYQGHEYQRMLIEELTQIPDEKRYLQLLGSCRSTVPNIPAQVFATTNPGGIGHVWVKKRFVDPAPPNTTFSDPISGRTRIFIPGKVEDNPTLITADPGYVRMLDALKNTDESLWKAWRLGDWDVFAGQFFREFIRDKHVVPAFTPKNSFAKIGGLDWGWTKPFCLLGAIAFKVECRDKMGDKHIFTRVIIYSETYGTEKTPSQWADIISRKIPLKKFKYIQADPAIYTKGQDGSISIADQFITANADFSILRPGSNDRIGGWTNLRQWLTMAPDGEPYLWITDNCINLIREMGEAVHDEQKVEDIDTDGSDHGIDSLRYLLKSKELEGKAGVLVSGFASGDEYTDPTKSMDFSLFGKVKPKKTGWRY